MLHFAGIIGLSGPGLMQGWVTARLNEKVEQSSRWVN